MITVTLLNEILFMVLGFMLAFIPKLFKLLWKFFSMAYKLRKYEKKDKS